MNLHAYYLCSAIFVWAAGAFSFIEYLRFSESRQAVPGWIAVGAIATGCVFFYLAVS